MDKAYLEEQLRKDYQLLKDLEDRLRVEDDPKRQEKLRLDIDDLKQKINQRRVELNSLHSYVIGSGQKQNSEASSSIKITQSTPSQPTDEANFISLLDLAEFCDYTFPLLRWMYTPVPAKHVCWYFHKIQQFFMVIGKKIPCTFINMSMIIECFFRCAYNLPDFDFQSSLHQIGDYEHSTLLLAYQGFISICTKLGYQSGLGDANNEYISPYDVLGVLEILRSELRCSLEELSAGDNGLLTLPEQDMLKFMIYIIDFLFKENKARKEGQRLDLPEGIVMKLHDILNHAFKAQLGVELPRREDDDILTYFPVYINSLSSCWHDS